MKKRKSGLEDGLGVDSPSKLIDARIKELSGWRGETLARIRALIKEADPEVVEEWKWDIPVWSHAGIICTGETYKAAVKTTFAKGAALPDPSKIFNSSLEGNTRRAIDFPEGGKIDEKGFENFMKWQIEEGIDFLVPCGSTGEAATLSTEERDRVVSTVVATAGAVGASGGGVASTGTTV